MGKFVLRKLLVLVKVQKSVGFTQYIYPVPVQTFSSSAVVPYFWFQPPQWLSRSPGPAVTPGRKTKYIGTFLNTLNSLCDQFIESEQNPLTLCLHVQTVLNPYGSVWEQHFFVTSTVLFINPIPWSRNLKCHNHSVHSQLYFFTYLPLHHIGMPFNLVFFFLLNALNMHYFYPI